MIKCDKCDAEFENKRQLAGHRMSHFPKKPKKEKAPAKEVKSEETQTKPKETPKNLTPDQQAIADRAAAEDTSEWDTIREDELEDFSLMENPLALPPEAKKMQVENVYAFRWCERTPDRIDQLTRGVRPPLAWKLCTRTTTPFLAHYVDDIWGCICKLDQALLFKPWSHYRIVQEEKQKLGAGAERTSSLKGKRDAIEERTPGVEAYEGERHKIRGGDLIETVDGVTNEEGEILD